MKVDDAPSQEEFLTKMLQEWKILPSASIALMGHLVALKIRIFDYKEFFELFMSSGDAQRSIEVLAKNLEENRFPYCLEEFRQSSDMVTMIDVIRPDHFPFGQLKEFSKPRKRKVLPEDTQAKINAHLLDCVLCRIIMQSCLILGQRDNLEITTERFVAGSRNSIPMDDIGGIGRGPASLTEGFGVGFLQDDNEGQD